ncbi:uncharacterized protein LOC123677552 [Harmonia axyridis]|uniref:uncharacterized protein LOC123677552 n=1 Tax=Harmonia axyridis TaxID=115357 RepID=UPI001E27855B|nr:uncharacterized protein LOC123677552 [Harmonia axyridis]
MSTSENREWVKDFIRLYHSEPCLWKTKSKEYQDTKIKDEAYEKLIKKISEVEPGANKEKVLRKIDNLRYNYTVELKKVWATKSEMTGIETYEPELWYFPLMRFLDKEEKAKDPIRCEDITSDEDDMASPSNASSHDRSNIGDEDVLELGHEEDFHDLFGKMVAMKMKKMSEDQRLLAKKMVDDILHDAACGKLTAQHCLLDGDGEIIRDSRSLQESMIASSSFHSLYQQQPTPSRCTDDVEMKEED